MHESQRRDLPIASPPTEGSFIGRPRFVVMYDQLKMLLEHQFTVPQIGKKQGVSVSTVRQHMVEFGLSVSATYWQEDLESNNIVYAQKRLNITHDFGPHGCLPGTQITYICMETATQTPRVREY